MATVELPSGPLPRPPPEFGMWLENQPNYASAYTRVLAAEDRATQQDAETSIIYARVAGYLLLELFRVRLVFGDKPCSKLVKELLSPPQYPGRDEFDNVIAMGEWYKDYFIRLFRTSTGPYPVPSSHPSRTSFDTLADMTRDCMMADGKDYKTARRKTLARDGFRCIITGTFDEESMKSNQALLKKCQELGSSVGPVFACHILSQATMQGVDPAGGGEGDFTEKKTQYAVNAMSILKNFGVEHLAEQLLSKDGVHVPANMLSLDGRIHQYFDKLNLWFESTHEPHRYYVCVAKNYHRTYIRLFNHLRLDDKAKNRPYVQFSKDEVEEVLPDPRLLDLHAVCARVAHMSGAAEVFDQLERDVGGTSVLASDGSSAPLVDHLLIPLATISGVA